MNGATEQELYGERMTDGPHAGRYMTQMSQSYLRRVISEGWADAERARAELDRRGTPYHDTPVEISNHAIDRASTRCLDRYLTDSNDDEGLFAWLVRVCAEAITWNNVDGTGNLVHKGMRLKIDFTPKVPILVTVMRLSSSPVIDSRGLTLEVAARERRS